MPGIPLDDRILARMESSFGEDFSRVRVHTDHTAGESAKHLNAAAWTYGHHVAFAPGQFAPGTRAGDHLIAHELAHVVQQAGRPQRRSSDAGADDGSAEASAADAADRVLADGRAPTQPKVTNYAVARQAAPVTSPDVSAATANRDDVLGSVPVTLVITPVADEPRQPGVVSAAPLTAVGLGAHVFASGDLSWLSNAEAARRVLSPEYWEPLIPRGGRVTLDRLLGSVEESGKIDLPRDLGPRIEAELAARAAGGNRPLSWTRRGFSEAELIDIPQLVRRLSQNESLTAAELDFLARAANTNVGGSSAGSPFASYSRPGFNVTTIGERRFRVRVEVERGAVLDVSQSAGPLPGVENVDEAELMVVANAEKRIVSVQRLTTAGEEASFVLRYSGAIRWTGRLFFVAGLGVSAYRVAAAPEGQRHIVAGQEIGGQVLGAAGSALAVAGCVALGVATGGVGLLLCGLAGGIAFGAAGSYLGGAFAGALDQPQLPSRPMTAEEARDFEERLRQASAAGTVCPSCHELQRRWEAKLSTLGLLPISATAPSTGIGAAWGTQLSPADVEVLRQWMEAGTEASTR